MLTVLQVLKKSEAWLEQKGVKDSRLSAEYLCAHVLELSRLNLFLKYKEFFPEDKLEALRALLVRRGKREPLQYLLEYLDFDDVKLQVNKNVLIPRPETEEMVYLIKQKVQGIKNVLDLGTGSGAISISLAKAWSDSSVTAVDVSEEALNVAKKNAKSNKLSNIEFLRSSWFEKIDTKYDLIVSNPPYLSEEEWSEVEDELKFEPRSAFVAKEDGLADLKHILSEGKNFCNKLIVLETGPTQHEELTQHANSCGYSKVESLLDVAGKKRFIFAWL